MVFPGQTTGEIDAAIERMVADAGATSATIGYKGTSTPPHLGQSGGLPKKASPATKS